MKEETEHKGIRFPKELVKKYKKAQTKKQELSQLK